MFFGFKDGCLSQHAGFIFVKNLYTQMSLFDKNWFNIQLNQLN